MSLISEWLFKKRKANLFAQNLVATVKCLDRTGIPVKVGISIIYQVKDVSNAAARFNKVEGAKSTVGNVAEGHMRAIMGILSQEELLTDRATVAETFRSAVKQDMNTLGLETVAMNITSFTEEAKAS